MKELCGGVHVAFITFQQLDKGSGQGTGWLTTLCAKSRGSESTGPDQSRGRTANRFFGTHTGSSLQIFTSSAVSPASRMSRLTRDTLPVWITDKVQFHIKDQAKKKKEKRFQQTCSSLFLMKHVELLARTGAISTFLDLENTRLASITAIKYRNYLARVLNILVMGFWSTPFFGGGGIRTTAAGAASVTRSSQVVTPGASPCQT